MPLWSNRLFSFQKHPVCPRLRINARIARDNRPALDKAEPKRCLLSVDVVLVLTRAYRAVDEHALKLTGFTVLVNFDARQNSAIDTAIAKFEINDLSIARWAIVAGGGSLTVR